MLNNTNMNKQKIIIETNDVSTLINGLNNAIIAYNEVVNSIYLGCEIPLKLHPLKNIPFEKLRERQHSLKDVYMQLIEIEKKGS